MNRQDIRALQQVKGYPCVTITLPTHRTSPENKQDPIRIKNLVKQAGDRLLKELDQREAETLLTRLDALEQDIDVRYLLDGLALFVSRDLSRAIHLPVPVKERVVLDETFFTRDLVFALNRTPNYWVLALSEKPTRLFEGNGDRLTEIRAGGFPVVHEGPGGEQALPGGEGVQRSAHRDERHRQFFRQVGSNLKPFLAEDTRPLVVVGVERYLAFFEEVTTYKNSILTTLAGSHDKTSPHELAKLVWPLVKSRLAEQRQQVFNVLDKAVGERLVASSVGEVWRAANEGRGRLLLVEEDFHVAARVDSKDGHLVPADDVEAPGVIDDAVDEIIETVLSKQGQVVFVEHGQLEAHQRIALILRY